MPTYVVESTLNPGVTYVVGQAEYDALLEQGLIVGSEDPVSPGVFDATVAALIDDEGSDTRAALVAWGGTGGGGGGTGGVFDSGGPADSPTRIFDGGTI